MNDERNGTLSFGEGDAVDKNKQRIYVSVAKSKGDLKLNAILFGISRSEVVFYVHDFTVLFLDLLNGLTFYVWWVLRIVWVVDCRSLLFVMERVKVCGVKSFAIFSNAAID